MTAHAHAHAHSHAHAHANSIHDEDSAGLATFLHAYMTSGQRTMRLCIYIMHKAV
jgi:hypothetical protein